MHRQSDRKTRHARVRAKVIGTAEKPRLSVFRSNRHIIAQLIDDQKGFTLASADDISRKGMEHEKEKKKTTPVIRAEHIGQELARRALGKKIKIAVFDRGGYRYHGIIRAVAEGARKGGLKF